MEEKSKPITSTPSVRKSSEDENQDGSFLYKVFSYLTPRRKKSSSTDDISKIEDQTPAKLSSESLQSQHGMKNQAGDGEKKKETEDHNKIEEISSSSEEVKLNPIKESSSTKEEKSDDKLDRNSVDSKQQDVAKKDDLHGVQPHVNLYPQVEVVFGPAYKEDSNANTEAHLQDTSGSGSTDKGQGEKEETSVQPKKSKRKSELERLSMNGSQKDQNTHFIMDHPKLPGFEERTDDPFYTTYMMDGHAKRNFQEKPTKKLNHEERKYWSEKKLGELKHTIDDFESEMRSIQRMINDNRLINLRSKIKITKRFAQEIVKLTRQINHLDSEIIPGSLYARIKRAEETWKRITGSVSDYYISSSGRSSVTSEAGSWTARESLFGDFVVPDNISEVSYGSQASTVLTEFTSVKREDYQDLLERHDALLKSHKEVVSQITHLKKKEQNAETRRKLRDAENAVKSYKMLISETESELGTSRPDREPEKLRNPASSSVKKSQSETKNSALKDVRGRVDEAVDILNRFVPGKSEITENEVRALKETLQDLSLKQPAPMDEKKHFLDDVEEEDEELGEAASVRASAAGCSGISQPLEAGNHGSRKGRKFCHSDTEDDDDDAIPHFGSSSSSSWEIMYQTFKRRLILDGDFQLTSNQEGRQSRQSSVKSEPQNVPESTTAETLCPNCSTLFDRNDDASKRERKKPYGQGSLTLEFLSFVQYLWSAGILATEDYEEISHIAKGIRRDSSTLGDVFQSHVLGGSSSRRSIRSTERGTRSSSKENVPNPDSRFNREVSESTNRTAGLNRRLDWSHRSSSTEGIT